MVQENLKQVDTLTPYEAARMIHKNADYIRVGLQVGTFDFGSALPPKKKGGRWRYNIIKSKFLNYAGIEGGNKDVSNT